jgi:hypothetical protein
LPVVCDPGIIRPENFARVWRKGCQSLYADSPRGIDTETSQKKSPIRFEKERKGIYEKRA